MSRFPRWTLIPVLAATGLLGGSAAYAQVSPTAATAGDAVYLVADLTGANEVRTPAAPAGDTDGIGIEVVRIQGNEVRYAIAWDNILAPTAAHIHTGITGVNGPVKVGYFAGAALPASVTAVVGRVTTPETGLLNTMKVDPGAFYANVHNAEFPGGAIRGQFRKMDRAVDLDLVLGTGFLRAHANGAEEISSTGAPGAGDLNGRGWAAVDARGRRVVYALKWAGIASPAAGHIHDGAAGVNGDIVVPLFAAPGGLPKSVQGIGGHLLNQDASLLARIRRSPGSFYVNLHNADFPAGAVRGQLRLRPLRELQRLG